MDWIWVGGAALVAWAIFNSGKHAEREATKDRKREQERAFLLDGTLMPVAAALFTGEITAEEANAQVSELDNWTAGVWRRWHKMSEEARLEMGRLAMEVYADPAFRARQDKLRTELINSIG